MDHTMKRRFGATLAVLTLTAGGLAVAGCGGDSTPAASSTAATAAADNGVGALTATEILKKASDAAASADSVTIKGDFTQGSETVGLNMAMARDAADGTLTINGVDVQLRLVGDTIFMKGSKDFWTALGLGSQGEVLSALVADKWFSVPLDTTENASGLSSLGQFTDKDGLLQSLVNTDKSVTVAGTSEINGQPVVLVSNGKGTLAIATTGEPYPIQVKGDSTDGTGTIDFINWNGPVNAVKPSGAIDLDVLMGGDELGGTSTGSTN